MIKYTFWSNDKIHILSNETEKYIYLVSIPAAFSSGQVPAVSFKTVYVNIWSGSCESMLLLVVSLSSMTTFSFIFATSDANNKNYTWSSRSIWLFIFIYKIKHHLIPSIVHQLVICRKVGIFNFIREKSSSTNSQKWTVRMRRFQRVGKRGMKFAIIPEFFLWGGINLTFF